MALSLDNAKKHASMATLSAAPGGPRAGERGRYRTHYR